MRDSDLPSIFDHLHDIAQSPLLSSCSPSSDGDSSCSSQLSNKPLISNPPKVDLPVATTPLQPSSSVDKKNSKISYSCELSKSKRLPRRVRTYHGRVAPVEKSESASIRRHTTMPPTVDEINESSDDYDE